MRLLRTTGTVLFAAAAALASGACTFLTGVRSVSRVSLTVAPDVIDVNGTAQAFGTAFDGSTALTGTNNRYNVTYTSRNSSVATVVEASGFVIGKAYGTTYIVGENNGKRDSALITVRPVQALQIIFGTRTPTYRVGAQNTISATGFDSSGHAIGDRGVTYVSRSPSVLTVSPNGVVAPLTVGTAWIVGSLDNGPGAKPAVDSALATVTAVPVYSIVVKPDNSNNNTPTVYVGQTLQFTATLTDSLLNSTTRPVTWSTSDNGRVLSISPAGLATGVTQTFGTTSVSASVDLVPNAPTPRTLTTSVAVAVLSPVDSVRVLNGSQDVTTLTVAHGSTTALSLYAIDALRYALTGRTFNVTSSNAAVVSVPATSSGSLAVTAGTAGTATITVQALDASNNPQGKRSTITVTVQ